MQWFGVVVCFSFYVDGKFGVVTDACSIGAVCCILCFVALFKNKKKWLDIFRKHENYESQIAFD